MDATNPRSFLLAFRRRRRLPDPQLSNTTFSRKFWGLKALGRAHTRGCLYP
jgi:hypothetical protein